MRRGVTRYLCSGAAAAIRTLPAIVPLLLRLHRTFGRPGRAGSYYSHRSHHRVGTHNVCTVDASRALGRPRPLRRRKPSRAVRHGGGTRTHPPRTAGAGGRVRHLPGRDDGGRERAHAGLRPPLPPALPPQVAARQGRVRVPHVPRAQPARRQGASAGVGARVPAHLRRHVRRALCRGRATPTGTFAIALPPTFVYI